MKRLLSISIGCIVLAVSGCKTTEPPKPPAYIQNLEPSYDGNDKNSGIIAAAPKGGFYVTPHFRDRYNALVETYGKTFSPKLEKDGPLTFDEFGGFWVITKQGMVDFLDMNQMRRNNAAPVKQP